MRRILLTSLFVLGGIFLTPLGAIAQSGYSLGSASIAVGVPIVGSELSYGDIIIFDTEHNVYTLSQYADDPRIFGIAVEHPPAVYLQHKSDVPVSREGVALVNVTLENGPIAAGDGIVASSIPGKGMRAASSSQNVIGIAEEAFTGQGASSTSLSLKGKSIAGGTILVNLAIHSASGIYGGPGTGAFGSYLCTQGPFICSLLEKLNAAPLVSLTRYLIAAAVAVGSLYLAFRTFMNDAVNGVISVGRNPRAKAVIQAMVVFNAIVAVCIAAVGVGAAFLILTVHL